jgi:hypothetical protein
MAFSPKTHTKRSSKNKAEKPKTEKYFLLKETTSTGLIFRKRVDTTISSTTDLKSLPNGVVVGFAGKKENVLLDYSNVSDEEDLNNLSSFFSGMEEGETFTVKYAEYLDERYSINTKTLEGDFRFLKYINNAQILAEKKADMGDFYEKMFHGKFFLKTIQYNKTGEMKSLKKTSKIINYVAKPKFKDMGIQIGDVLEFSGTKYNNIRVTVISVKFHDDGREELTVTEIKEDESRIGQPTKIQQFKEKKKTKTIQRTTPAPATSDKPTSMPATSTSGTSSRTTSTSGTSSRTTSTSGY